MFVRALKGKRHALLVLTPNLVHIFCIVVARHALTQRSKGQGHTVTTIVKVVRLLVTRAATAVCCCCWRVSACRYNCLCFLVLSAMLRHTVYRPVSIIFTFHFMSVLQCRRRRPIGTFIRLFSQILLPRYLMNGLDDFDKTDRVY